MGQAVACTPVTQRAWVWSPVRTSFLGEVFSSPVRQMSGSFRPPKVPKYHLTIILIHHHFIMGTNDLRCWRALKTSYVHITIKLFTVTRATLTFIFKRLLFFLDLQETEKELFSLLTLTGMSLCTVISTNAVNISSLVLLRRYVFNLFRVEKLLSTEAVVTGSKIQIKFKDFWGGPGPPVPLPCLRHWCKVFRRRRMLDLEKEA